MEKSEKRRVNNMFPFICILLMIIGPLIPFLLPPEITVLLIATVIVWVLATLN